MCVSHVGDMWQAVTESGFNRLKPKPIAPSRSPVWAQRPKGVPRTSAGSWSERRGQELECALTRVLASRAAAKPRCHSAHCRSRCHSAHCQSRCHSAHCQPRLPEFSFTV